MARRFKRSRSRGAWIALLVAALLLAARAYHAAREPDAPAPPDSGVHHVARVVDGDTFVLRDGTRVRLIGMDTPEMDADDPAVRRLAQQARQFAEQRLAQGTVTLRLDRERVDHYGRTLAYAYVDGQMLNEELLRRGLARCLYRVNHSESIKRAFRQAEAAARAEGLGIWQQSAR